MPERAFVPLQISMSLGFACVGPDIYREITFVSKISAPSVFHPSVEIRYDHFAVSPRFHLSREPTIFQENL